MDDQRQRAVHSVNIGWRDLPLAARLQDACRLPVTLGHDVRAGALAENTIGAARGSRNTLFVPVGTGVSAAVICDGRLLHADGYVGELGHVVVEPGGRQCACGSRGCLETVASAAAIQEGYAARCGRPIDGSAEVADRVSRGDADARTVWDRAVAALATALATATTMLAPELIVIGGGLAEAGELLLRPLRARLDEALTFQRRPLLVRAALGDRSGCLGAGLSAWEATGRPAVSEEDGVRTS
ncbi:ROK family protein [Streptomyces sp. NPDC004327]|uniref:ROK family protein n=1 Tax=Streptomyces sp. NPDC004327 TaxID=3364699 RepID=UPI0036CF8CB5